MIGVKGSDEAIAAFNQMKLRHDNAYIIFKVEGELINVESSLSREESGDDYLEQFVMNIKQSGEPRYGVVDWNHKLLFVAWSPDLANGRAKMTYASAREGFRQQLEGIQLTLQATDDGELTKEAIVEKTASNV
jgi:hypothetical protein